MENLKEETETTTNPAKSMRLGCCEVCAKTEARYACPKCEVKTCSLTCVQIHKRELNCDGLRDRTKYVPLSEMTDGVFMSDYYFLEECTRFTENRKQDHIKKITHQMKMLPLPVHRMRSAALRRGTRLQILLPNFSRHKENTTYLNWKQNRLYWRIEWLFVQAVAEDDEAIAPLRLVDERCDEELCVASLLAKYVDQEQAAGREQRKFLRNYQTAGLGQLQALLRAEGVRRSGTGLRCHQLALNKSLKENLVNKTIVEFPTIYVTLAQPQPTGYEIIESDDEELESESESLTQKRPAEQKLSSSSAVETKKAKRSSISRQDKLQELQDIFNLAAANKAEEDESSEQIDAQLESSSSSSDSSAEEIEDQVDLHLEDLL